MILRYFEISWVTQKMIQMNELFLLEIAEFGGGSKNRRSWSARPIAGPLFLGDTKEADTDHPFPILQKRWFLLGINQHVFGNIEWRNLKWIRVWTTDRYSVSYYISEWRTKQWMLTRAYLLFQQQPAGTNRFSNLWSVSDTFILWINVKIYADLDSRYQCHPWEPIYS